MRRCCLAVFCFLAANTGLTGCATEKVSAHDFCLIARPILVGKADVLTDETAKEILEHNETWKTLCSH